MVNLNRNSQGNTSRKHVSETIADRVHRHLRDRKSVITDEDIRNARIVVDIYRNYYEDFLAGIMPASAQ